MVRAAAAATRVVVVVLLRTRLAPAARARGAAPRADRSIIWVGCLSMGVEPPCLFPPLPGFGLGRGVWAAGQERGSARAGDWRRRLWCVLPLRLFDRACDWSNAICGRGIEMW